MDDIKKRFEKRRMTAEKNRAQMRDKIHQKVQELKAAPPKPKGSIIMWPEIEDAIFKFIVAENSNVVSSLDNYIIGLCENALEESGYPSVGDWLTYDKINPVGFDAIKKFVNDCIVYIKDALEEENVTAPAQMDENKRLALCHKIVNGYEWYTERPKLSVLFDTDKKYWKAFEETFNRQPS